MPLIMIPPADAPVDYPFEYERTVTLRDGTLARVRPVVPADAEVLAEAIAVADEETLYNRFFTPVVRLDETRLRYLAEVDYHNRFAIAALTLDGEGMAIARYEGAAGTAVEAEVAVTVTPEYRRLGLASKLFDYLEEAAKANGFQRLIANYLAENEPAEHLMASCGYRDIVYEAGVATVIKDISPTA